MLYESLRADFRRTGAKTTGFLRNSTKKWNSAESGTRAADIRTRTADFGAILHVCLWNSAKALTWCGIPHFRVQFRAFSIARRRLRGKTSEYTDGFSMLCKFQPTLLPLGCFLRKNSHFSILVLRNAGSTGSRKLGPD